MAVNEGNIGVQENASSSAKKLDTTTVTQTDATTAHREVVVLADPETLGAYTKVTNAVPTDAAYGSVTRPLGSSRANVISTTSFNSRDAATFAAAATFQGVGEDVSAYGRVGVAITSSNATDGTLTMEVSHDNVTWGGPSRTWADTRFGQPHMWNIVEKYFRIKYVNGSTEANDLAIQVQYSNNADILLGHQLNETLIDEVEAIVVRAVGVGQNPNDIYANLEVSGIDNNNSSTTNLTAATSLTFTGAWSLIEGYSGITVLIDGAAATTKTGGNLKLQFSHDGSTIHRNISIDHTNIASVNPRTLGVVAKYFRIVVVQDADLTSFDAQTMLHTQEVALVSRLDQTLQGTEDVANVRAAIVGQGPDGAYRNVASTLDGKLKTENDNFTHLLGNILDELKIMNRRLHVISGYEMVDNTEDF